MNNCVLDNVISVYEASTLWKVPVNEVITLCNSGDVVARRFGQTWVLDKNQPIPKQKNIVPRDTERFTVTVSDTPETVYPTKKCKVFNEEDTIDLAKQWSNDYKNKYVYIHYYRSRDGCTFFKNADLKQETSSSEGTS